MNQVSLKMRFDFIFDAAKVVPIDGLCKKSVLCWALVVARILYLSLKFDVLGVN
jgi:hypothetical protein